MDKITQNRHLIRFRYWSRKGYAMFASLGKCVTIGNLRKGVADISLGKQPHVCTLSATTVFFFEDDSEEKAVNSDFNLLDLLLQVSLVQPQQMVVEVEICLFLFTNVEKLSPKRCVMHLFGFFYIHFK